MIFDVAIVGGGIVGLSTAWQLLQKKTGVKLVLLEQENQLAGHQTGNNSGVIHSGLYYKPGSLKARNCVRGREMLYSFCEKHGLPFDRCGKLVIAVDSSEIPRLKALHQRGEENGLQGLKLLDSQGIKEVEPHAAGVMGMLVRETGIVDYTAVSEQLGNLIRNVGGDIRTGIRFLGAEEREDQVIISTDSGELKARCLVNCGGLHSDRIARLCGIHPELQIIPFRGEYYTLKPRRNHLVKNLIYPVPDPQFPFLGVHFTRMIDGKREAGPNAVLAFKREGYRKSDISFNDILDFAMYPGFWKMSFKHWKMGLGEFYRSFSKKAFVRALQRLIPEITEQDIVSASSGVRAQALESDGFLADDFRIVEKKRMVHVLNAPSPAATAGLSIGEIIADKVLTH